MRLGIRCVRRLLLLLLSLAAAHRFALLPVHLRQTLMVTELAGFRHRQLSRMASASAMQRQRGSVSTSGGERHHGGKRRVQSMKAI